ncbi:hypothetical protein C4D60_Mb09t16000 [Musa balbisiana]|uniref:Uncharacterized protein n=1 Tax=Musa balbisiana TaxID=52838 RepID=A0A4S8IGV3_MUSBA|nr:hypothetical protein C4D60_Mb09t16000 [Musa balbisiana]
MSYLSSSLIKNRPFCGPSNKIYHTNDDGFILVETSISIQGAEPFNKVGCLLTVQEDAYFASRAT